MGETDALLLRELHIEYSRTFPSALVLQIQGSAILFLRRRLAELKRIGSNNCSEFSSAAFAIPPALLTNATDLLQNVGYMQEKLVPEIDRNSPMALMKRYPSGREYKAWKKESEQIERKILAYRILRNKALSGQISSPELAVLSRKMIERRVKSQKKYFTFSDTKIHSTRARNTTYCKTRQSSPLSKYVTAQSESSTAESVLKDVFACDDFICQLHSVTKRKDSVMDTTGIDNPDSTETKEEGFDWLIPQSHWETAALECDMEGSNSNEDPDCISPEILINTEDEISPVDSDFFDESSRKNLSFTANSSFRKSDISLPSTTQVLVSTKELHAHSSNNSSLWQSLCSLVSSVLNI